ncbi:MAG: ABC transporter ATP-binding protein [Culicoidibacterales bacterium]
MVIVRVLSKKQTLLLVDELTGSLDTATGQEVLKIFQQLMNDGVQCMIITDDANVAKNCCSR